MALSDKLHLGPRKEPYVRETGTTKECEEEPEGAPWVEDGA